ncbi:MAG: type II secretion system protein GspD [Phycisphaerales bacterium]
MDSEQRMQRTGGGWHGARATLVRAGLIVGLAAIAVQPGCSRQTNTRRGFDLDQPRTSGGVFIDTDTPVALGDLASAIDDLTASAARDGNPAAIRLARAEASLPAAFPNGRADTPAPSGAAQSPGGTTPMPTGEVDPASGAAIDATRNLPLGTTELVELDRLSDVELSDLIDRLVLEMQSVRGYVIAPKAFEDDLPPVPRGVRVSAALARTGAERTQVLRLGSRSFASQPPQLWLFGATIGASGDYESNEDLSLLVSNVEGLLTSMREQREDLTVFDLEKTLVKLSYVDSAAAMSMLRGMGVETVATPEEVGRDVAFERLPLVLQVPDAAPESRGLVGADLQVGRGEFGVSLTPSVAGRLADDTISSPTTQLMVMWHPAHPGQFSRVRELIDEYIDRPARQIFVEGMVLEISDQGLKDLGIEWQLKEGPISWRFGSPRADGQTDTLDLQTDDLDFWRVFTRDFEWKWSARIRTLIEDSKAEVLSRPSVLTLDNRQSTIRVGEDIPVATSTEGTSGTSNRISFSFKYLPTGILLNIRPRVNEQNTEVSMLIDTIVSSVVPNSDLVIRTQDGDELASAPTISTRRVQTYARIRNNTPFIIGGLVSREDARTVDKVPFLGDLPLIGGLFRAERSRSEKREVIIVLTPFILPDDNYLPRSLPKDEDIFDNFGHQLFRDSYRIREDDVFDLGFLYDHPQLKRYKRIAREYIARDFQLGDQEPFRSFAGSRMPGEHVLVTRMIYEVVKRLDAAADVRAERMIFFESERPGGYEVRFLADAMARVSGPRTGYDQFWRAHPGKAFVIEWTWDADGGGADGGDIATNAVPRTSIVDCPDRETWTRLSWEMNQPLPDGRQRSAIVLADESDVTRLKRAIALKQTIELNGGREALTLENFSVGKVLLMPGLEEDTIHVLDRDVARFFAWSEHYYGATIDAIREAIQGVDDAIGP